MKKRLLKTAIMTALAISMAAPAFANPFVDVPANHWAYRAVSKLVSAGLIDGYNDGTFRGDKTVTRYEMAQLVAKAMNKSLSNSDKEVVNKLSYEFATELEAMGIKVEGMQKQLDDMVKFSGTARVRYFHTNTLKDVTDYRAQLTVNGKVNEDIKFNARASSGNVDSGEGYPGIVFDTANVTVNAWGVPVVIGNQDYTIGSGFLVDTSLSAISADIYGFKVFGGNILETGMGRAYGAEYSFNIGKSKLTLDYMKDVTNSKQYYAVNTDINVIDGITVIGDYVKNQTDAATGIAYGVKFNNLGLTAVRPENAKYIIGGNPIW